MNSANISLDGILPLLADWKQIGFGDVLKSDYARCGHGSAVRVIQCYPRLAANACHQAKSARLIQNYTFDRLLGLCTIMRPCQRSQRAPNLQC